MIDKLKNKTIIMSLTIFMLTSLLFLAFIERQQQDYDYQKDWWVIYFEDIKNNKLDFILENHSNASDFHWSVTGDKNNSFQEGDIEITKGAVRKISININEAEDSKFTIRVIDGKKFKEIYKDFRK